MDRKVSCDSQIYSVPDGDWFTHLGYKGSQFLPQLINLGSTCFIKGNLSVILWSSPTYTSKL